MTSLFKSHCSDSEFEDTTQEINVSLAGLNDISISSDAAKHQIKSSTTQINNLQISINKPKIEY